MKKDIAVPQDFAVLVWWSEDEDQYIARCLEIPACTGIGQTPGEAVMNSYGAVEDHLDYRVELDLAPPKPTTNDQRHGRRTLHRRGSYELIRTLRAQKDGEKPDLRVVPEDEDDGFDYEAMMREEGKKLIQPPDEEDT